MFLPKYGPSMHFVEGLKVVNFYIVVNFQNKIY